MDLFRYKGDFDTFEQTKAEKVHRMDLAAEKSGKARAKVQAQINKNIGGGSKAANMAKSRQKMLEKMAIHEKAAPPGALVNLRIPAPAPVSLVFLRPLAVRSPRWRPTP